MTELRPYQRDLLQEAQRALAAPKARVMLQLATGGGKTRIAAALLAEWIRGGGKAAWLTHRRELSTQTRDVLSDNGIWAANALNWGVDDPAPSATDGVVIEMVQTISRRNKHRSVWDEYGPKDLLVIDEAHHAPARGWERTIRQWPGPAIGLTATPWRIEKNLGFDHLFDCLIPGPQIKDLQLEKHLANAQALQLDDDDLILVGIPARDGDYREEEIERLNETRHVWTAGALEYWQKYAAGRQTIVYAVSKRHAEILAEVFNNAGVRAAVILGNTPGKKRDWVISQFKDKKLQILVNVAVATEGIDLPDASCIVLARPTMSLALYLQMVGRGLRLKDDRGDCMILDLAGNVKRHDLPDVEREWSLEPRARQGEGGPPPVVRCPDCERVSPASSHDCRHCGNPFGKDCQRCGQWRAWKRWSAETYCDGDHDLVCDRCHPDAHILDNLPVMEGLKEMLRKEPVYNQSEFKLSDLDTVEAAREQMVKVMEDLLYAMKVDDYATFTHLLEKQLKPLLRREKRLRKDKIEELTAQLESDITPSTLKFITKIEDLYEGRRKVTSVHVDFGNSRMSYQWEENGEVHTSEPVPFLIDELET